jgi:hypothetical protein
MQGFAICILHDQEQRAALRCKTVGEFTISSLSALPGFSLLESLEDVLRSVSWLIRQLHRWQHRFNKWLWNRRSGPQV